MGACNSKRRWFVQHGKKKKTFKVEEKHYQQMMLYSAFKPTLFLDCNVISHHHDEEEIGRHA